MWCCWEGLVESCSVGGAYIMSDQVNEFRAERTNINTLGAAVSGYVWCCRVGRSLEIDHTGRRALYTRPEPCRVSLCANEVL